jgi:hypothetical protein
MSNRTHCPGGVPSASSNAEKPKSACANEPAPSVTIKIFLPRRPPADAGVS